MLKPMHYSKETQFVLAELQKEGFTITERIANFVEGRHRRNEPTGYLEISRRLKYIPI